jgi:hypothetical protein
MLKQIVFLKKRDDMTMKQFMEYYENQHSASQEDGRHALATQRSALRTTFACYRGGNPCRLLWRPGE